jgi:hypothetical protein
LNHLLVEGGSQTGLDIYRAALKRTAQLLGRSTESALTPIEPTETIFRLDLRILGWEVPLLKHEREALQPVPLNRFDLLLLEYPYGVLPPRSDLSAELGREFLDQASQIRPLLYIRGDRFAVVDLPDCGKPALNDHTINQARELFQAPLGLPVVQTELGWSRPPAELQQELKQAELVLRDWKIEPLARGELVPRAAWERAFPHVVRQLRLGTPMIPLDGLTWPDWQPEPSVGVTSFRTEDGKGKPKTRFAIKDNIKIMLSSKSSGHAWLGWTDAQGKISVEDYAVQVGEHLLREDEITGPTGTDRLTLYFLEAKDESAFPKGDIFTGQGQKDRLVHPFYEGWYDPAKKPFDPVRVMKKTIEIEIK